MANEVTLATQQLTYGGPDITTLLGSTLAAKYKSIQVLGPQAWLTYIDGQAGFLNTLKSLKKGDIALLVPKVVPADFPILTAGGTSAYPQALNFIGPDGQTVTEFVANTHLGESFRIDPATLTFTQGAGTVEFRINGGSYASLAATNTALASVTMPCTLQCRVTHAGACAFTFTLVAATA